MRKVICKFEKGEKCGYTLRHLLSWLIVAFVFLGIVGGPFFTAQIRAGPVIVNGDSYGYWEDEFGDKDGIHSWDNVLPYTNNIRLLGIPFFSDDFTGTDGDPPDASKWDIITDGYTLEIENNQLKAYVPVDTGSFVFELVQNKQNITINHTLTWRQEMRSVSSSGMYYTFWILNGDDDSPLFGTNVNSANQFLGYNYYGGPNIWIDSSAKNGWFNFTVVFEDGKIEYYYNDEIKFEYDYGVSSVKYQFGHAPLLEAGTVLTDDIIIRKFEPTVNTGNITSTEITVPPGYTWDSVEINKTEFGLENFINISVLNGTTFQPIPGFENLTGTNIDISALSPSMYPSVRLLAHFAGNETIQSPVLHKWKVNWIDNIPPATPTGLTVEVNSTGGALDISWNPNTEPDLINYSLYRSTDNVTYDWIANISAGTEFFLDQSLTNGVKYYYKISASDEMPNESPLSADVNGTPEDLPPNAPQDLTVTTGEEFGVLILDWTANPESDVLGYCIYRSKTEGGPYTLIDVVDIEISYVDVGLKNNTTYFYVIQAFDTVGNSSYSDEANSTTLNPGILPPEGLAVTNPWTGYSLIISWRSYIEFDVAGHLLYFSGNNVSFKFLANIPPNEIAITHYGLICGKIYYYKMYAYNNNGNVSNSSVVVNGTPDLDIDTDGIGNEDDNDDDGDTILDDDDTFPQNPNEWLDTDGDTLGNNADLDDDDDGYNDTNDAFPLDPNEWRDYDGDGTGDEADLDDDNDGIPDLFDPYPLNPLNDMESLIQQINSTVNLIKSNLTIMNLTEFLNALSNLNESLINRIFELENTILDNLTEMNATNIMNYLQDMNATLYSEIKNLLTSITNDIIGINDSISGQLTDLLNDIINENHDLRDWLDIVLTQLDTNLTITNETLQIQMSELEEYVDGFNNSLQNELVNILSELQLHDSETGQNHSDIIDKLNDLLSGGIGAEGIADLKTMLIKMAGNLSAANQSIANDILSVVGDIDEFERGTSEKLDEINKTLADLIKLDNILTELALLDSALKDAQENLDQEINEIPTEKAEDEEKIGFTELLLIIAIVLLIVNLLIGLMGMKRKGEGPIDEIPMQIDSSQYPKTYQHPPQQETSSELSDEEEAPLANTVQQSPPPPPHSE